MKEIEYSTVLSSNPMNSKQQVALRRVSRYDDQINANLT